MPPIYYPPGPLNAENERAARRAVFSALGNPEQIEALEEVWSVFDRHPFNGEGCSRERWMEGHPDGGLGEPLTHRAVRAGNAAAVFLLIKKGADPIAENSMGIGLWGLALSGGQSLSRRSALLCALADGGLPLLRPNGEPVLVRDQPALLRVLDAPEMLAASRLLLRGDAKAALSPFDGSLAVRAALGGDFYVPPHTETFFKTLAQIEGAGALDEPDSTMGGQNALMICVQKGMIEIARILLDLGANPNAKAHGGASLDDIACMVGTSEAQEIMRLVAPKRAALEAGALRETLDAVPGAGDASTSPSARSVSRL
jgi:hypothetical protein